METKTIKFASEAMECAVKFAKDKGFKVYGFQHDQEISKVFIANNEGICTIHTTHFGLLDIATCHKPCQEYGTGFGLNNKNEALPSICVKDLNDAIRITRPHWLGDDGGRKIKKWANWEEYVQSDKILTYFEI